MIVSVDGSTAVTGRFALEYAVFRTLAWVMNGADDCEESSAYAWIDQNPSGFPWLSFAVGGSEPTTGNVAGLITGGVFRVVTDLAVFGFDPKRGRMQVISINPGVTRDELQDNTGFALEFAAHVGATEPPTEQELRVVRELDPERLYTA